VPGSTVQAGCAFAIKWDWLPVFPQALDIAGHGVLCHYFGFGQGATVGDAPWQGRHYGGESTLGLRPENNSEMVARFLHLTCVLYLISGVPVKYRIAPGLQSAVSSFWLLTSDF